MDCLSVSPAQLVLVYEKVAGGFVWMVCIREYHHYGMHGFETLCGTLKENTTDVVLKRKRATCYRHSRNRYLLS